jgi:pimeloyl-ACP methyl ester carboxylesterase
MLKTARNAAVFLGVLLLVAIAGLLALRAYGHHRTAQAVAIHSPNGIEEGLYVKIGGIDQWIQIRGQDRKNPVLLCLHGGPGASWLRLTTLFLPWEKKFTVVQWDQRGTGKTLETTGASIASTMSVDRMAEDGIEVAEFLRGHLHKDKIVLLGFSWGSLLGIHMAMRRPDLFDAYVGTGQISDMPHGQRIGYEYALSQSRVANDAPSVTLLTNMGPPPFDSRQKIDAFFQVLEKYECESDRNIPKGALFAPNLSLWDLYNWRKGVLQVPTFGVYHEMVSAVTASLGTDFQIPMFVFQGALDKRTPAPLAQEYFDQIHAPRKAFVRFEGVGHFAAWTMPDRFLQELVRRVRPLAMRT